MHVAKASSSIFYTTYRQHGVVWMGMEPCNRWGGVKHPTKVEFEGWVADSGPGDIGGAWPAFGLAILARGCKKTPFESSWSRHWLYILKRELTSWAWKPAWSGKVPIHGRATCARACLKGSKIATNSTLSCNARGMCQSMLCWTTLSALRGRWVQNLGVISRYRHAVSWYRLWNASWNQANRHKDMQIHMLVFLSIPPDYAAAFWL